jgi:hypothetical protein
LQRTRGFAECTEGGVNNETATEKKKMLHWDSDFAYITHNEIVALMNGGISYATQRRDITIQRTS